jgi:hypothetical protein
MAFVYPEPTVTEAREAVTVSEARHDRRTHRRRARPGADCHWHSEAWPGSRSLRLSALGLRAGQSSVLRTCHGRSTVTAFGPIMILGG